MKELTDSQLIMKALGLLLLNVTANTAEEKETIKELLERAEK